MAKKVLDHMRAFATLEKENGSLTMRTNQLKKIRKNKAINKCYKQWRFVVSQNQKKLQIIVAFKAYASGKLLNMTFKRWQQFSLLKKELRDRNNESVSYMNQITENRLASMSFACL